MGHESKLCKYILALAVGIIAAALPARAELQVVSITTPDDPTGEAVPVDGRVVVTFSEAVDPDTVNSDTFAISNIEPNAPKMFETGDITPSDGDTVFTFVPDPHFMAGSSHQVAVVGQDIGGGNCVKDAGGTPLAQSETSEFRTVELTLTVELIDPEDGRVGVPITTDVTVTFSEPVDPATVNTANFILYDSESKAVEEDDGQITCEDPGENTIFTFTPKDDLAYSSKYLPMVWRVTDPDGNPMAEEVFHSEFQTRMSGGTYVLEGNVKYEDTQYDSSSGAVTRPMSPARHVALQFYDQGENLLGENTTDSDGYYGHDFGDTNPGPVTAKVLTERAGGNQKFYVKKQNAPNEVYSFEVAGIDLEATSLQHINITGDVTPAFNIHSTMALAWDKVTDSGFFGLATPGNFTLTAYWEAGVNNTRTADAGRAVYYDAGGYNIDVPGDPATLDDGFNDCILLEAFARFVQNLYSRDDAPGDRHYAAAREDGGYGVRLDLRQAWSEGWAHFFSSAVRDDPRSVYVLRENPNVKFDIEAPKITLPYNVATSGPQNQFGAASLLWYIYDSDKTNNPAKIWSAFTAMTQAATLEEFYRAWAAKGYPIDNDMDAAALARGIKYQDDGVASTIADAQTAPLRSVGSGAIACTFYPAGDVDYFRFQASQGQEIKATTSALSCGADTVLAITDSDGFVLAQEIAGRPARTWDDLDGAVVSSIKFTAPSEGTNDYFVVCRHSTELLPLIDNDPDDGIAAGSAAYLGAYSITITSSPGGVSVAEVNPAHQQADVPLDLERVLIVFDGPVEPGTVTTDTFIVRNPDGDAMAGTVSQVDATNERYFEFILDAGELPLSVSAEYTVEVTDGVKDPLGNGVNPFLSTFRTIGPFVETVSPADEEENVALDTTVTITFAAEVNADTVDTTTFTLFKSDDQTPISGTVEQDPDNTREFTFTPDPAGQLETSTEYMVVVTGVSDDTDTITMATPFSSTFTTESLKVASWNPANGATDVPVTQPDDGIVITFNGPIDPATALDQETMISSTITLTRDADTAVDSYAQAIDQCTVILHPPAYFRGETTYTVTVTGGDDGVKGINGDTMTTESCSFTTAARPARRLGEAVPRVLGARAYAGSGFIDLGWTNPFGDWGGLIIAGSTVRFPTLEIGTDNDGNPTLAVTNGQVIYQGELDRESFRIGGLTNSGNPVHINVWIVNGLDHSRAASLESRAVAGGTGMPGATGEGGEFEEEEETKQFVLSVSSLPFSGVTIEGTPGGKTPYADAVDEESAVTLTAPAEFQLGQAFAYWTVNDVAMPDGQVTISFEIFETTTAVATYGEGAAQAGKMAAGTGSAAAGPGEADGNLAGRPTTGGGATGPDEIDIPDEPPGTAATLEEPVVAGLPRPLKAKAAAGSGFVDVKWEVPDEVDGIIVAVGHSRFPLLKIARDSQGNSGFAALGGAIIYEGGESKKLRFSAPNGIICRFNLWTYSGGKVSRAVSLESRAVAGGTGLQ